MTKKEILQTIQLRQSTLKDYLNCPMMFKFRHLDKLQPEYRHPAALHGSVIHKLLYMIHDDKWNLNVANYYGEIFERYEFGKEGESKIPVKWKDKAKELAAYESNANEMLDNYRKWEPNQQASILYAEQRFRVKIGGYVFTGTIDQVRRYPDDTTELLDFKSSKQRPNDLAMYNDWQLALYQYAIKHGEVLIEDNWIKPKLHPDYCSIYFLRTHEIRKRTTVNGKAGDEKGEPLIRTQKSPQDIRQFREQVLNLLKAMLKDWHFPNPNHCNLCNYKSHCLERAAELPKAFVAEARKRLKETQAA
ncbi:MAG: PD-(D/E)XK nuclease family protein [candidate division Zixibacteria bacterium]|nr:PD-(D/E)XK nuclease family protein [candidate division Zixibacteria bacterium]